MDWSSTLIGAAIAFLSSVGIIIVERMLDHSGKIKIYTKIVYQYANEGHTWEFHRGSEGIFFSVPIWLELENTSNTVRSIRDVNLVLYKGEKKIAEMIQINSSGKGENTLIYANNGGYSFVLEPRSICQYKCLFLLKQDPEKDQNFDKIMFRYYNEKDKEQLFTLAKIVGDWKPKQLPRSGKWERLK